MGKRFQLPTATPAQKAARQSKIEKLVRANLGRLQTISRCFKGDRNKLTAWLGFAEHLGLGEEDMREVWHEFAANH